MLERRPDITVPLPPPTKTQDIVDTLHGVAVPDPYRLAGRSRRSGDTHLGSTSRTSTPTRCLTQLPGRDHLREMVTRVLKRDAIDLPTERGGRYFFSKRRADQELAVVHVRDGVDGEDEVLIDPHPMSEDHTTSVSLGRHLGTMARSWVYEVRERWCRRGVDPGDGTWRRGRTVRTFCPRRDTAWSP